MKHIRKTRIASAVALASSILLASGCGGGSSGGDDEVVGDNVVSRGIVTGFGSVYVNGVRFGTDDSSFSIDDHAGDEDDLRIGMVVTVHGSSDDDGQSWTADSITYDNELKGPISEIVVDPGDPTSKTLTILGQTVLIDSNTTIDDDGGLTFDTIAVDDVVEVSGYQTGSGLRATHIELQDNDDEIEIKGVIANLDADSFEINGFDVSYDGATELDDIDTLSDGLYVEVEGQLNGAGTTLIAEKIEAEDEGIDDDADEAEIEGVIYDYDDTEGSFMIQGQMVDAGSAEFYPASLELADGITVKVEGHMAGGILVAEEIEQKGKKIEITAPLSAVGASTITFSFNGGDIVVQINHETELEDDTGNPVSSLADFSTDDFVEMEAFDDGSGVINAVELERKTADEIKIEAPLDGFDSATNSVQLLGVDFDLSAADFEDDNNVDIDGATFFGLLADGEFVEIKDADRNGVFEKAELDD